MGKNFLLCGFTGWCLEILFTAFDSFRKRDLTLVGRTSVWMFPIYGMAAFLKPIYQKTKQLPVLMRSLIYSSLIFLGEYISGSILKKHQMCPWDYSKSKANIKGVIRLDYAPYWMVTGLLYEKLLLRSSNTARNKKNAER